MRPAALLLALLPFASAQTLIMPEQAEAIVARVQPGAAANSIPCDVEAIRPALSFAPRLQTGYLARVPLDGYSGPGHSLTVVVRVAPNGSAPSYLADRLRLPADPEAPRAMDATGVFFLGEGSYHITWMLVDDSGRACVKNWDLEARAPRGAKLAIAPGAVAGLAPRGPAPARTTLRRLTILVDAAPVLARGGASEQRAEWVEMPVTVGGGRGRAASQSIDLPERALPQVDLRPVDQTLLLGGLSAVLERLAAPATRIVAFNLRQQKEIYRSDHFTSASLGEVAAALSSTQFATVDYHVLLKPKGHIDLLAGLMNRELRADPPADAVLFLGPRERFPDDFPAAALDPRSKASPRFYFLAYGFPDPPQSAAPVAGIDVPDEPGALQSSVRNGAAIPRPRPAGLAAPVAQAVRKAGGKVFSIQSPRQFSRAIHEIEKRSARRP